jgi:hypothetical protein
MAPSKSSSSVQEGCGDSDPCRADQRPGAQWFRVWRPSRRQALVVPLLAVWREPSGKERPVPDSVPGANVGARWAVERNSARAPLLNSLRGTVNHPVTVPEIGARLLNALGFSLPAGQRREPERRPTRPGRTPAALSARTLSRHTQRSPTAETLGKPGQKRQRPRGSLLGAAVYLVLPSGS